MPVPPPLLRDCIPGELLLRIFCYREFIPEPVSNTRQKSGKNKVQGTIIPKSNSAIFDIWDIPNVEANDGVIFIKTLEFNVILMTIVAR